MQDLKTNVALTLNLSFVLQGRCILHLFTKYLRDTVGYFCTHILCLEMMCVLF